MRRLVCVCHTERWVRPLCGSVAYLDCRRHYADPPPPVASPAAPPLPPPPPPPATPAPPPRTAVNRTPGDGFVPYYFREWQKAVLKPLRSEEDELQKRGAEVPIPSCVYVFGEKLGPRPLIILDQSQSDTEGIPVPQGLPKYEPLMRQLEWEHGVVYIPLPVPSGVFSDTVSPAAELQDPIGASCERVRMVMDMLDIRWSHFLTYSFGALVAARMASSPLSPSQIPAHGTAKISPFFSMAYGHRVGTILLVDTPLISSSVLKNYHRRNDIMAAEKDVNVPLSLLTAAKEQLMKDLEPPLVTPCAADAPLYEKFLFDKTKVFPVLENDPEEGENRTGLLRDDRRYVPLPDLLDLGHPVDLIVPAEHPVADVAAFKELFGVRRATVIKSAKLPQSPNGKGKEVNTPGPESLLFACLQLEQQYPRPESTMTKSTENNIASEGEKGGDGKLNAAPTSCSAEMANTIRSWMLRFEPDAYIAKDFMQAIEEMKQVFGSASSSGGEVTSKEPKEKKKKEKKKKK